MNQPRQTFKTRSSLVWRLLLPVPIALVIGIVAVWALVPKLVASMASNDAIIANQQVAGQFKAMRSYYSEWVVKKVVATRAFTASHDHKNKSDAIPLPATLMHDLSAALAEKDTTVALYSPYPFPDRKGRQLDDFQRAAWDFLIANPKATFSRGEMRGNKQVVRMAVADIMSAQSCIDCHNSDPRSPKQDWKLGDVRGVLEVSSVIDAQLAHGTTISHMIVAGAIAIGVLLLVLTFWVARNATRPLGGMVRQMNELAAGNFDVVLPGLDRKDEIGAVAKAVEMFKVKAVERARSGAEEEERRQRNAGVAREAEMTELAGRFEAAIGNIAVTVSSVSRGLETAATTLMSNADTTKRLSGVVAGASKEASANVQSVSSATAQLARSVLEISSRVQESSSIASAAVRQANETDARIAALSSAATSVSNVVSLITDIAEQTNLLALNATIEAARAGDAGRGFAVVAAEVKSLATQTAQATGQVSAQIAEMQAATRDSVSAIKEIGTTISRISHIALSVAQAIDDQRAATDEIARNVDSARHSTTEVADNLGDVSRAANETDSASGEVLSLARSLASEGDKLKVEVEKFLTTVRAA
jgi:methyl-accepting chemotaxis protein